MKKDMVWPCRVSAVVLTIDAEGNYSLERMNQERYVSVAFITGEAVGSKEYDASNPIVRRIESNKDIKEVVLATNPTLEGETTALYISRLLQNYPITISRLAYGLPMGGQLDYADELTLTKALEGRNILRKE